MDVVLGVAVTGQVARLALVEAAARGSQVLDQSTVELSADPVADLTETVVGTNRLLADEGHRLVATRLVWSDQFRADQLRQALDYARVPNVEVVSESKAAGALLGPGRAAAAVLLIGNETASFAVSGDPDSPPTVLASTPVENDPGATFDTLMAQIPGQAGSPNDVLVVGSSPEQTAMFADHLQSASTMGVQIPPDSTFALAQGAAADATMAAPVIPADGPAGVAGSSLNAPMGQQGFAGSGPGGAPTSSPDASGLSAGGPGGGPTSSPDASGWAATMAQPSLSGSRTSFRFTSR